MAVETRVVYGPPPLTRICRALLIINAAAWLTLFALARFPIGDSLYYWVALVPKEVVTRLALWQLVTTMFVHDLARVQHLLFNMISLYFFGPALESKVGSSPFLRLYMISGLVGSVCTVALAYGLAAASPGHAMLPELPVVGASGAIFGVLVAYAIEFPASTILLFFIIPVKARTLAIGLLAFNAFFLILGANTGVAYSAHLGGALGGWLYYRKIMLGPPRSRRPGPPKSKKAKEGKVIEGRFRDIMKDV